MGFADYLNRNLNGVATPPSEKDKQFIIHQINDFKFMFAQNTLRTNRSSANNQRSNYDVINRTQSKQTHTHAFCHSCHRNELHAFSTHKFQPNQIPPNPSELNQLNKYIIYKKLRNQRYQFMSQITSS